MQTTTRQIARTSGITPSQCLRSAAKRHLQAKRPSAQPQYRPLGASFATSSKRHDSTRFVPTILQPSFWRTIIPKSLRTRTPPPEDGPVAKSKEWNPATFFIVIFLLIGSQAIQTIALQRSYTSFSNQTEARLSLLRDVLRRVQAGEDVDVETALGTGNEVKEKEWEEVMRELEEEDRMIQTRNQRRRAKEAAAREAAALAAAQMQDADPNSQH